MELPPLPPLPPYSNHREIGKSDAFLFLFIRGTTTIISVDGAIGHFNPQHQVLAWIGKFADHRKSDFTAVLTLSYRAKATGH
jgi:hypothetical protein